MKLTRIALAIAGLAAPVAAHAAGLLGFVLGLGTLAPVLLSPIGLLTVGLMVYGTIEARRRAAKAQAQARAAYNASLQDRAATLLQALPPMQTVYGRCIKGGFILAQFTSDKGSLNSAAQTDTHPDAYKHIVMVFAAHECEAVHDVLLNGVSCFPLDGEGYALPTDFNKARTQGFAFYLAPGASKTFDYPINSVQNSWYDAGNNRSDQNYVSVPYALSNGDKTITNTGSNTAEISLIVGFPDSSVRIQIHLGSDNQEADPFLMSVVPGSWTAAHRLRGLAYLVVTLDLTDTRWQSGPPQITVDVSGKKVYDPRDSMTRWSQNNALCIRDWLMSEIGGQCVAADIDDAFTIAAANVCDTPVEMADFTRAALNTYFDGTTTEGWTAAGATTSVANGSVTITSTSNDPQFVRDNITIDGGDNRAVRARIKRTAGSTWDGSIFYMTSGHGYSASYYKRIATEPTYDADGWADVTWDMSQLTAGGTDWINSDITAVRIDLGNSASDVFMIDYISIGPLTAPLYTCNGVVSSDQPRESVLIDLAESMAGEVSYGAQWMIQPGSWTTPVMDLGEADLDGIIQVEQGDYDMEDSFNGVRGTYIPANSATPVDFEPYSNAVFVQDDGRELWKDLQLPFTDSKQRCTNIARITTEKGRNGQIIRYPAKLKAWPLQSGDRVRVTDSEHGWSNKYFMVIDWQFDLNAPVVLTLQEDSAETWDLADAVIPDPTPNTGLSNPWDVLTLEGFNAASGGDELRIAPDGTIHTRVRIYWDLVTDSDVTQGGYITIIWRRQLRDPLNAWHVIEVPGSDTQAFIDEATDGDILTIIGFTTNSHGCDGNEAYIVHEVIGKSAPPIDVTGLSANIGTYGVDVSWSTDSTDIDYDITELRQGGSDWASATPLYRGKANRYTWLRPAAGSYTLRAKHIDTSGNPSAGTASTNITVSPADAIQWGNVVGRPKAFRVVSQGFNVPYSMSAGLYDENNNSAGGYVNRSYIFLKINRTTGAVAAGGGNAGQYDVFGLGQIGGYTAANLANDLNATTSDYIVVVFTYDEPLAHRLDSGLDGAMYRCGASRQVFGSQQFKTRSAYVLVGIAGCGEGNGFEAYAGAIDADPGAWCDVSFTLLNGQLLTSGASATPKTETNIQWAASPGMSVSGNVFGKFSGNEAWDANVYSLDSFVGGCYAAAIISGARLMFGLNRSTNLGDTGYALIDFAMYIDYNRHLSSYEFYTGVLVATDLGIDANPGDDVSITYDGANVRYHWRGLVLRTVPAAAGERFYFDSSFYNTGNISKLDNVRFGPMSPVTGIGTGQLVVGAATDVFRSFTASPSGSASLTIGTLAQNATVLITATFPWRFEWTSGQYTTMAVGDLFITPEGVLPTTEIARCSSANPTQRGTTTLTRKVDKTPASGALTVTFAYDTTGVDPKAVFTPYNVEIRAEVVKR